MTAVAISRACGRHRVVPDVGRCRLVAGLRSARREGSTLDGHAHLARARCRISAHRGRSSSPTRRPAWGWCASPTAAPTPAGDAARAPGPTCATACIDEWGSAVSAHTGWTHCPRCAGPLRTGPVDSGEQRLHCPACGLVLYDNPAPTATAIVTRGDGAILLTRRAIEPAIGMLDLPGGFIEAGEDPEQAVKRELLEETGLEIELTGYVGRDPRSVRRRAPIRSTCITPRSSAAAGSRRRRMSARSCGYSRCASSPLPDCVCQRRRCVRTCARSSAAV